MIQYSLDSIGLSLAKPYQSPENAYRFYKIANRARDLPEIDFRAYLLAHHPAMVLNINNNYTMRNCVQCSRRYFHSSLYNVPWLIRCPIHTNEQLLDRCPECGMHWFVYSYRHRECTLCGTSGRAILPKQSEVVLIEQALAPIVAAVSTAYPEWFQCDSQCALQVIDVSAQCSIQMLIFGCAYQYFKPNELEYWRGKIFQRLPFKLQPTVLSECLPQYAQSIRLSSKVFPYSKLTSSLISKGIKTIYQVYAMYMNGFDKHDVRPYWLDASINTIFGNIERFLASKRLCRCYVENHNTCRLCKMFLLWKEEIIKTASDKHFLPKDSLSSNYNVSASHLGISTNIGLPPSRVIMRLNAFEFDCYEVPDDFRKMAFSINLYSLFCDDVLHSFNLTASVGGNSPATEKDSEPLNEYLLQRSHESSSLGDNNEFFDLFKYSNSNSLFYFFDKDAKLHMLYPKLIEAIMGRSEC